MSSFLPGKNPKDKQALQKAFKQDLPARSRSGVFILLVLLIGSGFLYYFSDPLEPDADQRFANDQQAKDFLAEYRKQQEQLQKELELLDPFSRPRSVDETISDEVAPGYVRVAAAQLYSRFGKTAENLKRMEAFIKKAAETKAQIIVFPEAAVCGYADLNKWDLWAADPKAAAVADSSAFFHPVSEAAQPVDGKAFSTLSKLAADNHIIIAYGYIEKSGEEYYSSLQLIGDDGTSLANYRKKRLWAKADPFWAHPSMKKSWSTVDTKPGKIGLLISYDFKPGIEELAKLDVDIIIHSCAFYGDNLLQYFSKGEYVTLVKESGASIVMANWANPFVGDWGGYGLSRVIAPGGLVLAARGANPGEFLVMNDLPVERGRKQRKLNRQKAKEQEEQQENSPDNPQEEKQKHPNLMTTIR